VLSGDRPGRPASPGRSQTYLDELKRLRDELALHDAVIFAADELDHNLDYATVAELYRVVDALLFPSAQEGFGLPILEAGWPGSLSSWRIFRYFEKLGR
jgi:glycosyltransferase involved in cell wall biosynthesis